MDLNWDYTLRLVICIIILALGVWAWQRSRERLPLLVGIAFGLFGIYYLVTLLASGGIPGPGILVLRYIGYFIVIYALYDAGSRGTGIRLPG